MVCFTLTSRSFAFAPLLICLLMVGCQAPGYLLDAVIPPDRIPAAYNPDDRRTLVFIDDRAGALPQSTLRGAIAASVAHHLERTKVVSDFIPHSQFEQARLNEDDFDAWSVVRVGRHLEAEQVIYVTIDRFEPADPEQTQGPSAAVRVRLVDVESGNRLFPEDGHGYPVRTQMSFRHNRSSTTTGASVVLAQNLAHKVGEDVAKLFHRHAPRAVGSGFDDD